MKKQYEAQNVIVADDDDMIAKALKLEVVNRFSCQVDTVRDGDALVQSLQGQPYDLVITDMLMPGVHGLDLVTAVATNYPDIDILVTTGYPSEFPYVDVISAGASDFIIKPINTEELSAKILRIMKERVTRGVLSKVRDTMNTDAQSLDELRTAQKLAEAKYRGLFELSMNGMVITDPDTFVIREANQAFSHLVEQEKDRLEGTPFFRLVDAGNRDRLKMGFEAIGKRGQGTLSDIQLVQSNGHKIFIDISINFVHIDGEHFVQITCQDVTVQRELQLQLERIAQTDSLTGLLNKNMFHARVDNAVKRAQKAGDPLTLMLLDLDDFKQCNDTYGHQEGDAVLAELGAVIRNQVRGSVDESYRIGGDEFAVLLVGAGAEIGLRVGERVRAGYTNGNTRGTSLSIGICELREGMNVDTFVRATDNALYEAKAAGKNTIRLK